MKRMIRSAAGVLFATGLAMSASASIDVVGLDADFLGHASLGEPHSFGALENLPRYANTTNFTGQAFVNGGAANGITRLVSDDITRTGAAGEVLTAFTFSVANLGTGPVSARPRVRFYAADGAGGGPGSLIGGFSFNPIAFPSGVGLFSAVNLQANNIAMPTAFWAGITFDNVGTNATNTQLDLLGQGLFDPPTQGGSADRHWISSAAGSNFVPNPAGAIGNSPFGANPVANYGWSFNTVPTPGAMALLGLGGLAAARRRR